MNINITINFDETTLSVLQQLLSHLNLTEQKSAPVEQKDDEKEQKSAPVEDKNDEKEQEIAREKAEAAGAARLAAKAKAKAKAEAEAEAKAKAEAAQDEPVDEKSYDPVDLGREFEPGEDYSDDDIIEVFTAYLPGDMDAQERNRRRALVKSMLDRFGVRKATDIPAGQRGLALNIVSRLLKGEDINPAEFGA